MRKTLQFMVGCGGILILAYSAFVGATGLGMFLENVGVITIHSALPRDLVLVIVGAIFCLLCGVATACFIGFAKLSIRFGEWMGF